MYCNVLYRSCAHLHAITTAFAMYPTTPDAGGSMVSSQADASGGLPMCTAEPGKVAGSDVSPEGITNQLMDNLLITIHHH